MADWITTREAIELSGYHPDSLRRLVRAGSIGAKKWGREWMIDKRSLILFLKRQAELGAKRGRKKNIDIQED